MTDENKERRWLNPDGSVVAIETDRIESAHIPSRGEETRAMTEPTPLTASSWARLRKRESADRLSAAQRGVVTALGMFMMLGSDHATCEISSCGHRKAFKAARAALKELEEASK